MDALSSTAIAALCSIVRKASQIAMEGFTQGALVEIKADGSPVTATDKQIDSYFREQISASPLLCQWPILSEEAQFDEQSVGDSFWCIDPIDGTKAFIRGLPEFAINVALVRQGTPVFGLLAFPAKNLMAWNEQQTCFQANITDTHLSRAQVIKPKLATATITLSRSHHADHLASNLAQAGYQVSREHSSQKFFSLITGTAGFYPRYQPCMLWDIAAGHALLRAAGGSLLPLTDTPLHYKPNDSLYVPPFLAHTADTANQTQHLLSWLKNNAR